MKIKREYLVSYQFDAKGRQGFGAVQITHTGTLFRKYGSGKTSKALHITRKTIAGILRAENKLGRHDKVNIVIMNITRFPL